MKKLICRFFIWIGIICILIVIIANLFTTPSLVRLIPWGLGAFYVSPSGSGTACTNSNPCSLSQVSLSPGTVLYLKSGTYMRSTTLNFSASGISTARITISSAPGEHAIISGDVNGNNAVDETDGPRTNGATRYTPLVKLSGSYITFKDIEVKFSGGRGVQSNGSNNIISGLDVHHIWNEGVYIYGPNNIVEYNTVHRAAESNYCGGAPGSRGCNGNWPGGFSWGWSGEANAPGLANHITVRGNTVYNNSGEGLLCMHTDYSTVENNTVYDNWGLGIDLDKCSYATVRNNYIYYTADKSWWRRGTVGSATRPADGIFISNEYTQASGDSYPSGHDRIIENNLVVGAGSGLFFWGGDGDYSGNALINDLIEHNTIVINQGQDSRAIIIDSGPHSNTKIKNNIINQSSGTPASAPSSVAFSNNLWYPLDGINGQGDIRQDPKFVDASSGNYHLQSTSPACTGGEGGTYMGVYPCGTVSAPLTVSPTLTPVLPTATGTATPTPSEVTTFTPTNTPVAAVPSPTVTPSLDCVEVVWDKGVYSAGLNIRPGDTMHNIPPLGTYLGKGFNFKPLEIVTNSEGTFAKVAEPDWWVAMDLVYNNDTYAVFVSCP